MLYHCVLKKSKLYTAITIQYKVKKKQSNVWTNGVPQFAAEEFSAIVSFNPP